MQNGFIAPTASSSLHEKAPIKRPRAALSCSSCRSRKIKCDRGERPEGEPCTPCRTKGRQCESVYTALHANDHSSNHSPDAYHNNHVGEQLDDIKELLVDIRTRLLLSNNAPSDANMEAQPPVEPFSLSIGVDTRTFLRQATVPRDEPEPPCVFSLQPSLSVLPSQQTVELMMSFWIAEVHSVDFTLTESDFQRRWLLLQPRIYSNTPDPLFSSDEAITLATLFVALSGVCQRWSVKHEVAIALQNEIGQNIDSDMLSCHYLNWSRWIVARAEFARAELGVTRPMGGLLPPHPGTVEELELIMTEALRLVGGRFNVDGMYINVSKAIRLVEILRLNRDDTTLPDAERKRRWRLWRQVLIVERFTCFFSGRVPILRDDGKVPELTADISAPHKERYAVLRYSFPLPVLDILTAPKRTLSTTRRMLDLLDGWWQMVEHYNFAASSHAITVNLLDYCLWEKRVLGRQQLFLYIQYKRSQLHLCRPYVGDESHSAPGRDERMMCLQAARDLLALFNMYANNWQMLQADIKEMLPFACRAPWLTLAGFDAFLTLASHVSEQPASSDRDLEISIILNCRNTFAMASEHVESIAARALHIIDAVWPHVSIPISSADDKEKRRAEINEAFAASQRNFEKRHAQPMGSVPATEFASVDPILSPWDFNVPFDTTNNDWLDLLETPLAQL